MLKIKRTGGTVFYLPHIIKRGATTSFSNGKPVRDAAGLITSDMQWSRMTLSYNVALNRKERDAVYQLWKDSNPVLTTSGATTQFEFSDDEVMTAGWVSCSFSTVELCKMTRLPGEQEVYLVPIMIECSSSDFDTQRRALQ